MLSAGAFLVLLLLADPQLVHGFTSRTITEMGAAATVIVVAYLWDAPPLSARVGGLLPAGLAAGCMALAIARLRLGGARPSDMADAGLTIATGLVVFGACLKRGRYIRLIHPGTVAALVLASGLCTDLPALPTMLAAASLLALVAAIGYRLRRAIATVKPPPARLVDVVVLTVLLLVLVSPRTQLLWTEYYHQSYLFGAANDVLHGRTVLVDTVSQYGVGVVYFAAALLGTAVPNNNIGVALLVGVLAVIHYGLIYVMLRIVVRRLWLACTVLGLVLAVGGFDPLLLPSSFPAAGFLRFGLPTLLSVLILAQRDPRSRRSLAVQLAVVALSATWSVETMLYVCGVWGAVVLHRALVLRDVPGAMRDGLAAAGAALAGVGSVLAFTVGRSGRIPDVHAYLEYLGLYVGNLDKAPGALRPWVLVAVVYAMSLAWLAANIKRSDPRLATELRWLAVLSALGLTTLTYWIGEVDRDNLEHVAFPAFVLAAWWVERAIDSAVSWPRSTRAVAGSGMAMVVMLLLIDAEPAVVSKVGVGLGGSTLATVQTRWLDAGGGGGTVTTIGDWTNALRSPPPSDETVAEAVRLVRKYDTNNTRPVLLITPNDTLETLLDTDTTNAIPMATPCMSALTAGSSLLVRDSWKLTHAGDLVVLDTTPRTLLQLQQLAMYLLLQHFDLQIDERGRSGLVAGHLVPLGTGTSGQPNFRSDFDPRLCAFDQVGAPPVALFPAF